MQTHMFSNGQTIHFKPGTEGIGIITFCMPNEDAYLQILSKSFPNTPIYALRIDDWNKELSPWCAPPVFGDSDFGDGAKETLSLIMDKVIPMMDSERFVIGGYSLAGLFSLWACYTSDMFCGCAASSPSVWFPDWDSFIGSNSFKADSVCLSLGKKEHRTKNHLMSTVDDRIRLQYDSLLPSLGENRCRLIWNEGGHFCDIPQRIRSSFEMVLGDLTGH